ncbi:uncharacterized protein LOC133788641 [Humulus lupulus]|uniref:uncharacterized protein LOC133788641 n=1 Tax=Humulus lupulus TaxID=3486 RepID=UPI002B400A06|nr:uncharacterized protein LOC133788641 [Humulus lupulus]
MLVLKNLFCSSEDMALSLCELNSEKWAISSSKDPLLLTHAVKQQLSGASLIAERSFREVGAVLVQLEESQVARQALEAEKQKLTQQVESTRGEASEKIDQARRTAEEEADKKYLAKYREYRASAETEFKQRSDDLKAENSKLREELSQARVEKDTLEARLQSKNDLLLKRQEEYATLQNKLHEEEQLHKRSSDLVSMLELGLAEKDKEIGALQFTARGHVTEKQSMLNQNKVQRKEIDSLKGERDASKAEVEKLKAQLAVAEAKLATSEAERLKEKEDAEVVLNRTINISYVVVMHQLWKMNPEVLGYLGEDADAMREKLQVWDQGPEVYVQTYNIDEPAGAPEAGDPGEAGTSEPARDDVPPSNEPTPPAPVETADLEALDADTATTPNA